MSKRRLHVGCGPRKMEGDGWIHVDVKKYEHVDIVSNILDLDKNVERESVDEIYASHVLEHVGRHEVELALQAFHRVLKPGGVLRLSVPDLEQSIKMYVSGALPLYPSLYGQFWGGQKDEHDFHKCGFDFKTLKGFVERAGFERLERYDWRDFLPPGFDDYSRSYIPHMDFENGVNLSMNVVCVKKREKPVLIFCSGGFANAVDSIIWGLRFAKKNGLKPYVHWVEGYIALGAALTDVFDVNRDLVTLVDESEFKRMLSDAKSALIVTHNKNISHLNGLFDEGRCKALINPKECEYDCEVHSELHESCDFVFLHTDSLPRYVIENSNEYLSCFFNAFSWKRELVEKVDAYLSSFDVEPRVGLHLRGTDILVERGLEYTALTDFALGIANQLVGNSEDERILVCTDDKRVRDVLQKDKRFVFYDHSHYVEKRDERLAWCHDEGSDHIGCDKFVHKGREYKHYSWTNVYRPKEQVLAGVIDLMLLSRLERILAFVTSERSTYFMLACLFGQFESSKS